jgi:hypothetical protein
MTNVKHMTKRLARYYFTAAFFHAVDQGSRKKEAIVQTKFQAPRSFPTKGRFPLQPLCPRGRSKHVSTFSIGV